MIAVLYDLGTGRILSTISASEAVVRAQGKPYLEVPEQRDDYDVTHRVSDGKLIERSDG